ncbi:MAG TPA: hypothetical protein VIY86_09225, partial [Pirellulaceae bacterium]
TSQWAEALELAGRHADAVTAWSRAVTLADPLLGDWYRVKEALARARVGDHQTATRAAAAIADRVQEPGRGALATIQGVAQIYLVAADHVPASSEGADRRQSLIERYRSKAMRLLHRIADSGFGEAELLEKDPDFASVRGDREFQDIVSQIRGNTAEAGPEGAAGR